jgi:cytochrome c2
MVLRKNSRTKKKQLLRYGVLATALLVIAFGLFAFGFITARYELGFSYLKKIKEAGEEILGLNGIEERTIYTVFVRLNVREIPVPKGASGHGGGLTSYNDELVLLTHDGRIYSILDEHVEQTSISLPDHGLAAYKRVAQLDPYKNLFHDFDYFRYNDILHYREDSTDYLVLSYTEWIERDTCYHNTIARLQLPSGTSDLRQVHAEAADWEIIFRASPGIKLKRIGRAIEGHAAGGRMAYKGNHTILLGSGDYFWDGVQAPEVFSQDTSNDYGKVLEIDLRKKSRKIFSIGHRNTQGMLIDRDSGVWVTEHGPRGGDELNNVVENGNYGWPLVTLGTQYNHLPYPTAIHYGRHDGFQRPVYAWLPSKGISSLAQVHGFVPAWDGDLLVGSLVGRTLFRMRIVENRIVFTEPIYIGELIRYIHQHTNGKIALWTDDNKLLWIQPNGENYSNDVMENLVDRSSNLQSSKATLKKILTICQQCHSFTVNTNERAPYLGDIYGKKIGSTDFQHYSASLSRVQGRWTENNLRAYLTDPQKFAPGTSMPFTHLHDENTIHDLIDFFVRLEEYHRGEDF